jgi:oxepin-CoA hydrolase/3-oxo-5,6-dehydrosuberyl-CoA semialdehyde dehydrogenase
MSTVLKSYLSGEWQEGTGRRTPLVNPSTEEILGEACSEGLDFERALQFSRQKGSPALQAMTFAQRGELLRKLAKIVNDAREQLIATGVANAGNTRSDAKFDIDGAAATLLFYAEIGTQLGEVPLLADGEGIPLGRSARLYGQHVLVPRQGVAVHINAFNFPAWGMAEKLSTSLLAGVPVISKPATATALMANQMAELWIASRALPEGSFSFISGAVGNLLSHLNGQDVVAFTGSSHSAAQIRRLENLARHNVHLNIEADSLNPAILGPEVTSGSDAMGLFLSDVVKEMTQKAGQKCTAIRRIFVPASRLDEVRDELVERLREVRVGNPADEKTHMGPIATSEQFKAVRSGIEELAKDREIATGGPARVEGASAPVGKGYFVAPTLLVQRSPSPDDLANQLEVFGPVATLMAYQDPMSLSRLVEAGGGGLVSSIYSDDRKFTEQLVRQIAPLHGRITIAGEKLAGQSVPPGTVLPQLLHGGPGRAGGGEELGGARGLALYMQRVALQGHRPVIEQLLGSKKGAPA